MKKFKIEQLKENEPEVQYLNILQELPDIVYKIDPNGNFSFVNNSVRMLGYKPEELIGKHFSKIIHPDDLKLFARQYVLKKYKGKDTSDETPPKLFDERRTGQRKTTNLSIRLIPKKRKKTKEDRGEIIAEVIAFGDVSSTGHYATHIQEKNKKFLGTLGIIRDFTKHKHAEEKIKQHEKMLEESEKELKRFSHRILKIREEEKKKLSANLHSELGSMAVTLDSYLNNIEDAIKGNNLKISLDIIRKSKRKFEKSIKMLKRIIADLRPPDLDIVGLPDALREYFLNIKKQTGINIQCIMKIDDKKLTNNAAITLYRIVQEAITNIIKHSNAKKVTVRMTSRDNGIQLRICDNGKGFDTVKVKQGTKMHIGLRSMTEMAESLGGTFDITSTPGQGTEIVVILPI
ncbi:PAS domain S-box protein [candidate division WOR-3 bacterium]|nr:PAS domain S-box protein [candidate division WOR-3 bacterium]